MCTGFLGIFCTRRTSQTKTKHSKIGDEYPRAGLQWPFPCSTQGRTNLNTRSTVSLFLHYCTSPEKFRLGTTSQVSSKDQPSRPHETVAKQVCDRLPLPNTQIPGEIKVIYFLRFDPGDSKQCGSSDPAFCPLFKPLSLNLEDVQSILIDCLKNDPTLSE